MTIYTKLAAAYRVSCPIVSITTSDPAKTVESIGVALNCDKRSALVIEWDCARGLTVGQQPKFDAAKKAVAKIEATLSLADQLLGFIKGGEPGTILVVHNAHRFLTQAEVVQAVWCCRDALKANRRMLVLLGVGTRIPAELQHDVIELDEPLPTVDELRSKIDELCQSVPEKSRPDGKKLTEAANASIGLSSFAAEQLTALNMSKDGLSTTGVWSDKCAKINETPGLKVVNSGDFSTVAGVEQIKGFMSKILGSEKGPNCIVFLDEIEKALGGAMGDTSGVSQDQLGVLLQWMQDKRADGCILVGPPGAAKSAFAKACGTEAGKPTIQLDLGGMKGSLVGESEGRIREALKVIDSISGGKTLWLATSNNISNLPPELKRRFKFGTWFFDLPTLDERAAIWALYCGKFDLALPGAELLAREWTGAEIESCCEIADKTGMTVEDAAEYIVPVSISGAEQIERLRSSADGKFLSASCTGVYRKGQAIEEKQAGRTIEL